MKKRTVLLASNRYGNIATILSLDSPGIIVFKDERHIKATKKEQCR